MPKRKIKRWLRADDRLVALARMIEQEQDKLCVWVRSSENHGHVCEVIGIGINGDAIQLEVKIYD